MYLPFCRTSFLLHEAETLFCVSLSLSLSLSLFIVLEVGRGGREARMEIAFRVSAWQGSTKQRAPF